MDWTFFKPSVQVVDSFIRDLYVNSLIAPAPFAPSKSAYPSAVVGQERWYSLFRAVSRLADKEQRSKEAAELMSFLAKCRKYEKWIRNAVRPAPIDACGRP